MEGPVNLRSKLLYERHFGPLEVSRLIMLLLHHQSHELTFVLLFILVQLNSLGLALCGRYVPGLLKYILRSLDNELVMLSATAADELVDYLASHLLPVVPVD